MPLNVIKNFYKEKSIKLSDAFAVFISNNKEHEKEFWTCIGFTLPRIEQREEVIKYGNTSQVFLIPNYDSCRELKLEFYETINDRYTKVSMYNEFDTKTKAEFVEKYCNFSLDQKYDSNGYSVNQRNLQAKKVH